jgi:hypothetical protein
MPLALLMLLVAADAPAVEAGPAVDPATAPTPPAAATSPAAAAVPASATPEVHIIDEKEAVDLEQTDNVRLSLPTEDEVEVWESSGLRVQLGYGYAQLKGRGAAWSFHSQTVFVRTSVRLDPEWSLGVSLTYGTGPNGLRWNVTAEPTFFIWRQLSLTAGLGYAGLEVSDANRSSGRLRGPDEVVSRNLAAGEKLQSCGGSGYSGIVRAEYLFVLGALASTGPFVEGMMQWTRCTATFGRVDQETGRPVVLTQWWQQQGATVGWSFAWR